MSGDRPTLGAARGDVATVSAVDVLSDEVLQQLCMCLPGRELLHFSATARSLVRLVSGSVGIWKRLSMALLGEPICNLHVTVATRNGQVADTVFWRSLFRRGQELRGVHWSTELRSAFIESGVSPAAAGETEEQQKNRMHSTTVGSGHCAVGVGRLVVKVGGLRPECPLQHLHVAVFDLKELTTREMQLAPGSDRPERRLRHAACEVRPELTSRRPAILVLGGCNDRTQKPCKGGLQLLNILEVLDEEGATGRWHSLPASGEAPGSIWHHICGSFALGQRVVVFGGDFGTQDPEFGLIRDRAAPAGFVYVLDVDLRAWARVPTSGPAPTWRSLHAGFTHRDVSSHSERLVILGGCAENLRIFSSSDNLEPMNGHALDLTSFKWLPQPSEPNDLPPARLRLASEKMGEWLLLYGGHGESRAIGERARLNRLNLRTLRWSLVDAHGREGCYPAAPAATMSAGLVLGGVRFTPFGITTVPKLDVLILGGEEGPDGAAQGTQSDQQSEEDSDDEDDEEDTIAMVVRDGSNNPRRLILPRSAMPVVLSLLAGRQNLARAVDTEGEADAPSE